MSTLDNRLAQSSLPNVKLPARTTSQIDWWHARLTLLASAVTLHMVRFNSQYWSSGTQNHRDVIDLVWKSGFLVIPGFAHTHPYRWWFFHRGYRKRLLGSRTHFPKSRFSLCGGTPSEVFSQKFLWELLQHPQVPLVPASMVIWTWSWSNPISLRTHRCFLQTSWKISSQRFCTSGKLNMLWQYLVLKLRCNIFLPTLELWCRISA